MATSKFLEILRTMKILLTGIHGQVGSALAHLLAPLTSTFS